MSRRRAFVGATIFDGATDHTDAALLVDGEHCAGVIPAASIPSDYEVVKLNGGLLVPGFIDIQVNGGGGVLLNDKPTVSGIKTICDAHAPFGTTALLPTLITDTRDVTKRAIEAGVEAVQKDVPGFLGLHLEGPHMAVSRKGAHRADLLRPMEDADVSLLCEARENLPNLLVTVAPEAADDDQISELVSAGVKVSLGHTDTTSVQAKSAFGAGADCVTHLYNAMSPLTHREPGLVGAALNTDGVFAGLIADGHHVLPEAINIALTCKTGNGKLVLVTDAMSTIGSNINEFELMGRRILRKEGRLTLEDGTLAGADLDMISAVRFMAENTKADLTEALKMASLYPAQYLGIDDHYGRLGKLAVADFVHLDGVQNILGVWRRGEDSVANFLF